MTSRHLNTPKAIEAAERKAEKALEEQRLREAYAEMMKTNAGRVVLNDLSKFCMLRENTFTGNSWGAFNDGKRAVGLRVEKYVGEDITRLEGTISRGTNKRPGGPV